MNSQLTLLPLGGMGKVTQNMFVFEYEDEILIVDCGIGFPDLHLPGVDILIPDISYLLSKLEQGKKIVGMVLTHGHDDHIAATGYLLPQLPDFPIYASPLTAGFARNRISESEAAGWPITVIHDKQPIKLGNYFEIESFAVTHSVPDTKHFAIRTPVGVIYHGTDFKLDPSPVDGVVSDLEHIGRIGQEGVLCMLMDCLRVEREEWVKSESTVGSSIENALLHTQGKFIVTLMSSHIHRIQQTVDVAVRHGRKVAFIGRSVESNVDVALELKKLSIPDGTLIHKKHIDDYADDKLCLIIAGSQGQEGSSMMRAVYGEHQALTIKPEDKVVFAANAIPGNEIPYYGAIDELFRNGVDVVYPDIEPTIHQSGHGSAPEQQELLSLVKPKYVMPIGGSDRHRVLFTSKVAKKVGYTPKQILLPEHGEQLAFYKNRDPEVVDTISLKALNVDGLGVGDVGPIVLSDRKVLGQSGIIVLVLLRIQGQIDVDAIEVVSRGFVFMKQAEEVISFIKQQTAEIIQEVGIKAKNDDLRRNIERKLGRKIRKIIQREPVILPVVIEI